MTTGLLSKVWITGARGQLGTELVEAAPPAVSCIATDRASVDIGDRSRVLAFATETRPDLIINAAAYTAVDKAESEPDLAFRINRDGAANLAEAAARCGARLIHVSTDYVFDGRQSTPYKPADPPNPLNVYGESKLAGERAALDIAGDRALIVRTAWVYSAHGHNFVKTMLRLLRERKEVRVVCDQIGTPTHVAGLAHALWQLAERGERGTHHWTDAGVASWYDFAVAIAELCADNGIPLQTQSILPIAARDYPTPARRAPFTVLDKSSAWAVAGVAPHWRQALRPALRRMAAANPATEAS